MRERDRDEGLFCSFAKRGREVRWQVKYDPITCQWIKIGDAKEHQLSTQKQAIIDTLEESGKAMRMLDLARAADMKHNNCLHRWLVWAIRSRIDEPDAWAGAIIMTSPLGWQDVGQDN